MLALLWSDRSERISGRSERPVRMAESQNRKDSNQVVSGFPKEVFPLIAHPVVSFGSESPLGECGHHMGNFICYMIEEILVCDV